MLAFVVGSVISPVENSSAVDCTDGMTPSLEVCDSAGSDVNVSIAGAWSVAVSSSGTLNVDITPSGSGVTSLATDNVNIYTNTPNGYQLYLNATSGSTDIYNNNVLDESGNLDANLPSGTNTNHFSATTGTKASPTTLISNSWGYSLANNPSTFSKVEETSAAADSLITSGSKTGGSGDDLPVTYGFKADTKLTPGTYTTKVTYTAIAEVPNYTIQTVSPSNLTLDQASTDITIVTTTPSTELSLGDVSARIGTVDLANCSVLATDVEGAAIDITTQNGYWSVKCTYPGGLTVGAYTVYLTSSWHSATYEKVDGFSMDTAYVITSVEPNSIKQYDGGGTLAILTNNPSSTGISFGNISARFVNVNDETDTISLTSCTEDTTGEYRKVICNYPNLTSSNTYNVEVTSENHGTSYTYQSITSSSYDITELSIDSWDTLDTADKTIAISTNIPSSGVGLGTVTAKIDNANLTNCTDDILNSYHVISCTYIGGSITANGSYQLTVTATGHDNKTYVKANAITITIPIMQDFTSVKCAALPESTYSNVKRYEFKDARDNKTYMVSKLADGNCWMVENLSITSITNNGLRTFTVEDTNIDTGEIPSGEYTFPASAEWTTSAIADSTPLTMNDPSLFTFNANSKVGNKNADDVTNPYGGYYNWSAATLGVGNDSTPANSTIYSSICPKNWQMPDYNNYSDKSFGNLLSRYTTNVDGTGSNYVIGKTSSADAYNRVMRAPLFFSESGYIVVNTSTGKNILYNRTANTYRTIGVYTRNTYKIGAPLKLQGFTQLTDPSSTSNYVSTGMYSTTPGAYSVRCVFNPLGDGINSVSPKSWKQYNGGGTISINTDISVSSYASLGTISASIINQDTSSSINLTSCTDDTSGAYHVVNCHYPDGIANGTYKVSLSSSATGKTYYKLDAVSISGYSITSVSPTTGNNDSTTTITMVTTAETANSTPLGTITGKIGNTNLTNCTATTSGNYRAAQCTIPSGVTAGTYTVQFTASGHNNTTYAKASAVTIRAYLTVSGGTGSGYYAPNTQVDISANACNADYRFNNWTTTGGTIGNANASSTTVTTTTSNITVARNCIAIFNGITQMQQMTSTICSNAAVEDSKSLTDARDSNSYRVTKLADGYCWMTENLKYNGGTNLANQSGYDGRLYKWDSNISGSTVCPSGWIVPPNSGARSYSNLFQYYTKKISTVEASPLYFTRAGYHNGSSYLGQGSNGNYWSSTERNSTYAYHLNYDAGFFTTSANDEKARYLSVRCVFGS